MRLAKESVVEFVKLVGIARDLDIENLKEKNGKVKWKVGEVSFILDINSLDVVSIDAVDDAEILKTNVAEDSIVGSKLGGFIGCSIIRHAVGKYGIEAAFDLTK